MLEFGADAVDVYDLVVLRQLVADLLDDAELLVVGCAEHDFRRGGQLRNVVEDRGHRSL